MSDCTSEIFSQEAGLVCSKTIEISKLTKERDLLKEKRLKLHMDNAFKEIDHLTKKCEVAGKDSWEMKEHFEQLTKERDLLKNILKELAPWASSAQEDPRCCKELKDIFIKVLDRSLLDE